MGKLKSLILMSLLLALAVPVVSTAAPSSPTDETKVPHYFGPYPNWANSPFTRPDVTVTITGNGTGATATATVGANGTVTGFTITDPGFGYTSATVSITGAGTGARANAVITSTGVVTGVTVNTPGSGYTSPVVTITGGGATTGATATAFGGVDAVTVSNGGSGYTVPTVDFSWPDDPNGTIATGHIASIASGDAFDGMDANGTILSNGVIIDNPGSGYSTAPGVAINNGTLFVPVPLNPGGAFATVTTTLSVQSVVPINFGAGYTGVPTVAINDSLGGTGTGATATAVIHVGAITAINPVTTGSGYITAGGIRKFVDPLPGLCVPPACPTTGKYIPVAVPDITTFSQANGFADADYYEIALVQFLNQFSSDLPASLQRGYVQIETAANAAVSQHFPLVNVLLDGTTVSVTDALGNPYYAVTPPQYLGPTIVATKDKPVRIVFRNLLPTGSDGDLFLPTDSTMMGSGMVPMTMMAPMDEGTVMDMVRNPMCTEYPKDMDCFKDNRATLHLHGGVTPWISDGTPHQWITPADEMTGWPEGVSVQNVPDMVGANIPAAVPDCSAANDGCMTFYYTNQQSARLMFYHDHSWGITRLNVYSGEAAGYLITDPTEQALVTANLIPADQIPLVIQDRTFVPQGDPIARTGQLYEQDPTWDASRWGGYGNLWYHHVYMPAQNPGDPSGMSGYGRWMFGPWFWPPAKNAVYPPINNPYYDPTCNLNDPATWQYETGPFCEPALIPGTPNISVGMEQFNDTPVVNGTAYPTLTVQPKSYRLRILNAANDRFFNLQWYEADPTTANPITGGTEVALKPAELAAAQLDPVVFPTPDLTLSPAGPDWIQIGTEGGFLPAPVVVDGQQVTTWITDPTRFDVGNVDQHSLLLAPAERADVIVDFRNYAGKTLILYNDAPAAFPARVPSYDYYTGAPDLSPVGAPAILPGYGPNTRTIMQVKVAATTPAPAFNLTALNNAFKHHADGSGVFEDGQHPIIVGQAGYNSAYGANFVASGWCNAPNNPSARCDGFARISEQGGDLFGFNTLLAPNAKMQIPIQPKAIHDEMNASSFDDYGRMTANLGLEAMPATPGLQNVILYPYVNPPTEMFDTTNLPWGDIIVTPIAWADDGTQIWKVTHNGVDTHPIHFHADDVQLINRVTWDNIIIPPDANELGWKETIRVSPLEDTIVAIRPVIPAVPFELPNSIRPMNPMMPIGSTAMFNNIDPAGNPTTAITNQLVNFGWEYVFHCHILSHEEMDMMRPVSMALPPNTPTGLASSLSGSGNKTVLNLTWNDNSINETSFVVQRMDGTLTWSDLATIPSPLDQPNIHGARSYIDATYQRDGVYQYRVSAKNTVGYGGAFPSLTVQSVSTPLVVGSPPVAPTNLVATLQAGPQVLLTWLDNSTNESWFVIERSANGGAFTQIATVVHNNTTNSMSYTDVTIVAGNTYTYRVTAINAAGSSTPITASVAVPRRPALPSNLTATNGPNGTGNNRTVVLNWLDNSNNETGFTIQQATNSTFTRGLTTRTAPANTQTLTLTGLSRNTAYYFRIRADNGTIIFSAWVNATPFPITTNP